MCFNVQNIADNPTHMSWTSNVKIVQSIALFEAVVNQCVGNVTVFFINLVKQRVFDVCTELEH